jgi:hypothetical protein
VRHACDALQERCIVFLRNARKHEMKRPGDKTPEPAGGRAAQRLRMFEEARGTKHEKGGGKGSKQKKGVVSNEEQKRRKD